jgi:hypothetical protein
MAESADGEIVIPIVPVLAVIDNPPVFVRTISGYFDPEKRRTCILALYPLKFTAFPAELV